MRRTARSNPMLLLLPPPRPPNAYDRPRMSAPGIFRPPPVTNEPVRGYAPGPAGREPLRRRVEQMGAERLDAPLGIGGRDVRTGTTRGGVEPHRRASVLADVHQGGPAEVQQA